MSKSPYIANKNRLADVISAIQAMAVSPFHMCSFEQWSKNITGVTTSADHWKKIFEDHPEFFRLDSTRTLASLVWRRQFPKQYHVDLGRQISDEEFKVLPSEKRDRLTRGPLSPADIKTLIDAAINLHSTAVELRREGRWWAQALITAAAGLVGAVLGAWLKA